MVIFVTLFKLLFYHNFCDVFKKRTETKLNCKINGKFPPDLDFKEFKVNALIFSIKTPKETMGITQHYG